MKVQKRSLGARPGARSTLVSEKTRYFPGVWTDRAYLYSYRCPDWVPQPSTRITANPLLNLTLGLGYSEKAHQGLDFEDSRKCKGLKTVVGERGFEAPTPGPILSVVTSE